MESQLLIPNHKSHFYYLENDQEARLGTRRVPAKGSTGTVDLFSTFLFANTQVQNIRD